MALTVVPYFQLVCDRCRARSGRPETTIEGAVRSAAYGHGWRIDRDRDLCAVCARGEDAPMAEHLASIARTRQTAVARHGHEAMP